MSAPTILEKAPKQLKSLLEDWGFSDPKELKAAVRVFEERIFKKNEQIFLGGMVSRNFYFLEKGYVTLVGKTHKNADVVKFFYMENEFFSLEQSFEQEVPTNIQIKAGEAGIIHCLPKSKLISSIRNHPAIRQFVTNKNQLMLFNRLKIEHALSSVKIENKIKNFIVNFPGLIFRADPKEMASFLGTKERVFMIACANLGMKIRVKPSKPNSYHKTAFRFEFHPEHLIEPTFSDTPSVRMYSI